jgi:hypothetical protein
MGDIVVMTDHGSNEGSRPLLEAAVEILTGTRPVSIDARHFMTGAHGRAIVERGTLTLSVPSEDRGWTCNGTGSHVKPVWAGQVGCSGWCLAGC